MEIATERQTYEAEIAYQAESDEFLGHVVNVEPDLILFRGRSVDELREDFAGQVAFYEEKKLEHGATSG